MMGTEATTGVRALVAPTGLTEPFKGSPTPPPAAPFGHLATAGGLIDIDVD